MEKINISEALKGRLIILNETVSDYYQNSIRDYIINELTTMINEMAHCNINRNRYENLSIIYRVANNKRWFNPDLNSDEIYFIYLDGDSMYKLFTYTFIGPLIKIEKAEDAIESIRLSIKDIKRKYNEIEEKLKGENTNGDQNS